MAQSGLQGRQRRPEAGIDLQLRAAQIQSGSNRPGQPEAQSRGTEAESVHGNRRLLVLQPGDAPLSVQRQGCVEPYGLRQLDLTICTPPGLRPGTLDPELQPVLACRAEVCAANVSLEIKALVQGNGP